MTKPNLVGLDVLRLLAAVYIVVFHVGVHFGPAVLTQFFSKGPAATSFFFILSGFLLTALYGQAPLDDAGQQTLLWRRFTRLLPPYLLGLVAAVGVWRGICGGEVDPNDLLKYLTMTQTWFVGDSHLLNVPAWSASCLAFFYLTFPWILTRLRRCSSANLAGWMTVLWLLGITLPNVLIKILVHLQTAFSLPAWIVYLHNNPLFRWPEFILGIGAGLLSARGHWLPRLPTGWLGSAALAVLGLMALPAAVGVPVDNGLAAPLCLLLLTLALRLKWRRGRLLRPVANSTLVLYLLHMPLLTLFQYAWSAAPWTAGKLGVYLAFVTVLSWLLDTWLCHPLSRQLRRLERLQLSLPQLGRLLPESAGPRALPRPGECSDD